MLAHVWGLGLGVTSAYASDGPAVVDLVNQDLVNQADAPALLGRLTGATVPVLEQQTASVTRALQDRIRTDGLPLPGQATTVPDAFAIAAVLLPAVPPQPRGDGTPRASRSGPGPEAASSSAPMVATAPRPSTVIEPASTGPGADAAPGAEPVVRTADFRLVNGSWERMAPDELALTAAAPVETEGKLTAVLVPIAAGLLLTGAAMYKHRGIPSGH